MQRNDEKMQRKVREVLDRLYDREPPQFRDYLKRFRENPKSRVFAPLAEAYRRQGRFDEAIAVCRQGLVHHPEYAVGRITLARCFLDKKRYDEARQELEAVTQLAPENILAQRLLGEAQLGLGDKQRALHALRVAMQLAPQDATLDEKIKQIELSMARPSAELKDQHGFTGDDFIPPTPLVDQDVDEVVATHGHSGIGASLAAGFSDSEEEDSFSLEAVLDAGRSEDQEIPDGQETFHIQHVSSIFREQEGEGQKEITTVTLGNLYYSQGQYERALRIFEKVASEQPSADILQKVHTCRLRLGVDEEALQRAQKIQALRDVLKRVREGNA